MTKASRTVAFTNTSLQGNCSKFVPIPAAKTLEAMERKLETHAQFVRFIRRALTWEPNKRPTAKELLNDRWLQ